MVTGILLLAIVFITCGLFSSPSQSKSITWLFSLFTISVAPSPPRRSPDDAAAHRKTEDADIRQVFATFDRNNDGLITHNELKESLDNLGLFASEADLRTMVQKLDSNGDGCVDLNEFCVLYESMVVKSNRIETKKEEVREELKEAFDVFDENGDGFITVEELKSVLCLLGLKEGRKWEDCREMIGKVDVDGDGRVSFDEFRRMMNDGGLIPTLI